MRISVQSKGPKTQNQLLQVKSLLLRW